MEFEVPQALRQGPVLRDRVGREWLANLPTRVERARRAWDLGVDETEPVRHGAHAVVVPVLWAGQCAVLRVARAEPPALAALRAWDGNGAVRLFAADTDGEVCLLERLDAARTLLDVEPSEAAVLASGIVARLAVPEPTGVRFPTTREDARRIADGVAERAAGIVPEPWIRLAVRCAEDLAADSTQRVLVHADLTRENLVHRADTNSGPGEFVAIDPRPMIGDPERSTPEFLLRSVDDSPPGTLEQVLRQFASGLDEERATAWVLARTVDYWAWAARAGLTEDPVRCHRILDELAG